MNAGGKQQQTDGPIEQRARALLLASADSLPWTVRSRLAQARHAAVEAHGQHRQLRVQRLRRWVPAGAVAAAALALFVVLVPHRSAPPVMPFANGALEDIDLLASDVPLNGDQGVNYEFYEWAADEASSAPRAGTASGAGTASSGR